jgi:superfamily II DNA/RNA helicase
MFDQTSDLMTQVVEDARPLSSHTADTDTIAAAIIDGDTATDANDGDALNTPTAADVSTDDTDTTDIAGDTAEIAADAADADDDADDDNNTESALESEADSEPQVSFTDLGLPAELADELNRRGVSHAFAIQTATIPDALAGRDVLGRARTGSGKTLAFGLPLLAKLSGQRAKHGKPLGLVLVPTRELAMQVADALRPYAHAVGLRLLACFGGAPIFRQIDALRYGVEILIATPGRLGDLIERRACSLENIATVVLDEADEMADMGFLPDVRALLDQMPKDGQRLLFSATLDGAVDEIVSSYLNEPVLHEVDPSQGSVSTMTHHLLVVEPRDKAPVTAQIAARHRMRDEARTLLFVRTKLAVDRVAGQLQDAGLPAAGLHGGMSQRARTRTLAEFKEGRTPVLVATDVAARGIHVDGIDLVVHVDPTSDAKDYMHRAGRTARAGESGKVVTVVLPKQRKATSRLLESVGVEAEMIRVSPGHRELMRLTGARPVTEYVAERTADEEARRTERHAHGDRDQARRDRFDRDRPRWSGDRDRRPGYGDRDRSFGRDRDERGGGRGFDADRPRRGGFDRADGTRETRFGDRDRGTDGGRGHDRFGDRDRDRGRDGGARGFDRDRGGYRRDERGSARGEHFRTGQQDRQDDRSGDRGRGGWDRDRTQDRAPRRDDRGGRPSFGGYRGEAGRDRDASSGWRGRDGAASGGTGGYRGDRGGARDAAGDRAPRRGWDRPRDRDGFRPAGNGAAGHDRPRYGAGQDRDRDRDWGTGAARSPRPYRDADGGRDARGQRPPQNRRRFG